MHLPPLIPKPQSGLYSLPSLVLAELLGFKLAQQQRHLLPEAVEGFPPGAAAVLVPVADEEFVEETVDVV